MAKNQKHCEKKKMECTGRESSILSKNAEAIEVNGVQPKESEAIQNETLQSAIYSEAERMQQEQNSQQEETANKTDEKVDLTKEVEKWKNEYLRKAADFENYRKRMIKEKKDAIDYANETILQDIVNVLDDFDRGIEAVEKYATDAVKPYMQGFTMIRHQLYSMLENKYALKCYKSEGEVFDPNIHDAKASRESEDVEVETVEKELLKGYKLHDRVIRVAQVETVKPKK